LAFSQDQFCRVGSGWQSCSWRATIETKHTAACCLQEASDHVDRRAVPPRIARVAGNAAQIVQSTPDVTKVRKGRRNLPIAAPENL
jgi:hypothetical protein